MKRERRDGATVKRERIALMRKMLLGDGVLPADLSWFIAWCEVNVGLSPDTVRAYLKPLEVLGEIEVTEATDLIVQGKGLSKDEA